MNSSDWEKLRKNFVLLQKDINADELLPHLIQSGVFETGIRSELGHIPTDGGKVASLLEKLKTSPPEKEAYKCFLEALRSCEFDFYCELATTIEETETESDPSLHAKVDPSHFTDRVCQVLNDNFTDQSGQVASLKLIKSVLDENKVFSRTPWSDEYLTDFVCKLFAGVEVLKESTPQKNVLFKHIVKCELKNQKQDTQANQDKTDKDCSTDLELNGVAFDVAFSEIKVNCEKWGPVTYFEFDPDLDGVAFSEIEVNSEKWGQVTYYEFDPGDESR